MLVCLPDTSCLIHLDRIDQLDLLQVLYDDIRIPPTVRDEYGEVPDGIEIVSVPNLPLLRLLRRTVDAGEAEVIALGTELGDSHVILDDAAARTEAIDLELTVFGTVGLILRARREEHISAARPLLDARQESGFWMSEALSRIPHGTLLRLQRRPNLLIFTPRRCVASPAVRKWHLEPPPGSRHASREKTGLYQHALRRAGEE